MARFPEEAQEAHRMVKRLTDEKLAEVLQTNLGTAATVNRGSPVWWEALFLAEVERGEVSKRELYTALDNLVGLLVSDYDPDPEEISRLCAAAQVVLRKAEVEG